MTKKSLRPTRVESTRHPLRTTQAPCLGDARHGHYDIASSALRWLFETIDNYIIDPCQTRARLYDCVWSRGGKWLINIENIKDIFAIFLHQQYIVIPC